MDPQPDKPWPVMERLRAIAAGVPDAAFGARLGRVYEEGARAVTALRDLPLDGYDDLSETGSPDLSTWEKLAPVIRDTLLDINRLLAAVREQFPAQRQAIDELIGDALAEPDFSNTADALLKLHVDEATTQIQRLGNTLAVEISNLGERIRSPQVVSDQWNLISDLQEFRGKFRSLVGDLLFLSASAFASVERAEVIPGYAEQLREAIAARRSVTDLGRLMTLHATKFATAHADQIAEYVAQLIKDLDAFGRSRAYSLLRTPDKRRFVEFRALLRRFPDALNKAQALSALEEFAQFTQSLAGINKRVILVEHDHQALAACAVRLENADQRRGQDMVAAVAEFVEAVVLAQELYGRNPSLDAYLRRAKKRDLTGLSSELLATEIELLRGLLAAAAAV